MATISLSIPVAGPVTLALHQNNYAAIQTAVNALDTVNYTDASVTRPKLATVTNHLIPHFVDENNVATENEIVYADAVNRTKSFLWAVPDDYVSGDFTLKIMLQAAAAGTGVFSRNVYRLRDATATSNIETGVAMNQVFADTNNKLVSITILAAGFQAGDFIRVSLIRDGGNASDTINNSVFTFGARVEYTGRS